MRQFPIVITGLFLLALLAGCIDSPDLPTSISTDPDEFGANDTSFVRINPDWGASAGYDWVNPGEIHTAQDGYIYVADEKNGGRVVRLKLDGTPVDSDLFTAVTDTSGRYPIGLGQDSKLNLYMADGSNILHVRNTLADEIGIAEVVVSFDIIDLRTGDRYTIDNSRPIYQQMIDLAEIGVDSVREDLNSLTTANHPDTLARFSGEYVFIADTSGEHSSRFSDVDGGPAGEGTIYVTDQANDRIARYAVLPSRILILNDGQATYSYTAEHIDDAVEFGSGQVSTNNPTSVVTTGGGQSTRLYFTQVDGNFLFQRLRPAGANWQFDITASGDGPPLISLDYFGAPVAVAVGESDEFGLGLIYVADSLQNRVTAYYPGGSTFRHVAAETELIDLEPGQFIEDALAEMNVEWYPDLNQSLVGYYSSEQVTVPVDAGQPIGDAVAAAGYEFRQELNPEVNPDGVFQDATTVEINIPAESTVEVNIPTLDMPRGVATRAGVVFITDSGNNRIVRYSRSDSDSYIPDDPNF